MRYKHKLSFSVLMMSSCLVQVISAAESRSLTKLETIEKGGTIPKGSALVTSGFPFSSNITIGDGSVEVVDNGRTSMDATINTGGMQIVTRGGTAMNAKISGGKQFVHEEKNLDLTKVQKPSSAYDATVTGDNSGVVGQQNIYDGAWAWNTKVGQNGEQNLYRGQRKEGGRAENTVVSENGRQNVLAGGESFNTTLKNQAVQVVYPGGFVDTLKIENYASSWLHVGAENTVGEVRVNGGGKLYLFAGDATDHTTKEKISITGRADETIFLVGERNTRERPEIHIEDLGGEGGTVIFTSIPYDPRHISLNVDELSGHLHFRFNISGSSDRSDYLSIGNGKGDHKISVTDTGSEVVGILSQQHGIFTEIPLMRDRSGGANFTLADYSGQSIEAVDGGTYMYRLYKRERDADYSGSATTWYLGISTEGSERSSMSLPRTKSKPKTTVFSSSSSSGAGSRSQQRSASPRGRGTNSRNTSSGKNNKPVSKPRPPRHLRVDQQVSVSSTSVTPIQQISHQAGNHPSDDKQHPAVTSSTSSQIDQMTLRSTVLDPFSPSLSEEVSVSHFLTTPSTDAVLSMAVTPSLIFHNELQVVRVGRGVLDRSKKSAGLWTYVIKSKETISADHIDFKLDQTGIVLGLNGLSEWSNGDFYIGGFGSYDHARIAHARGGTSSINTYGIGVYATYFDYSGWYLDGILKYNYDQNTLKAVSTNGLAVAGNYDQWVVGSSFEAGYRIKTSQNSWFQPYGQFTWSQVSGKEIKLSNEMTGAINRFTSLRSEVGLSLGYEFGSGIESSSLFYLTASWLRENKDDNHTMINERHEFTTDLSGNAGKLGVGLSHFMSDQLKLYAQAHYVKGRTTKQSLQGVLGVRYSF